MRTRMVLGTLLAGTMTLAACATRNPAGPEVHSIRGHVKLIGYLVRDDASFAGTKVVGDADGVRVDLVFGTQVVRSTTTVDGVYAFTGVPQGGYLVRSAVANTVGDTTQPVTVSRLDIAVSDTLRLFAKGDLRPVPNPRADSTRIYFVLPDTQQIEVRILRLDGTVARSLYSGELASGLQSVFWNGRDDANAPAGAAIYWASFRSGLDLRAHLLFR